MSGRNSRRDSLKAGLAVEMYALMVCIALVLAAGCGGQTERTPTAPSSPPQATPPPPTTVWNDLGQYTMTMTTAPSCSLPDYAMARTYHGRLKERGQDLVADFDDPSFICGFWGCGFTGTKDGDTVHLRLNTYGDTLSSQDAYMFIYRVSTETDLGYSGTATGKMGDGGLATTFDGAVVLYRTDTDRELARCDARDHRIELARR